MTFVFAIDHMVSVLHADTGVKQLDLRGHTGPVRRVLVTAKGDRAFTASADSTVRVWDLDSGRGLMVLRDNTAPLLVAQLASDGGSLVTVDAEGGVVSYPASAQAK